MGVSTNISFKKEMRIKCAFGVNVKENSNGFQESSRNNTVMLS